MAAGAHNKEDLYDSPVQAQPSDGSVCRRSEEPHKGKPVKETDHSSGISVYLPCSQRNETYTKICKVCIHGPLGGGQKSMRLTFLG